MSPRDLPRKENTHPEHPPLAEQEEDFSDDADDDVDSSSTDSDSSSEEEGSLSGESLADGTVLSSMRLHPGSPLIAYGDEEGYLEIGKFGFDTVRLARTKAHTSTVPVLDFMQDGTTLISGSQDMTIGVTDVSRFFNHALFLHVHEEYMTKMVRLGRRNFITADGSGVVKIWDLRVGGSEIFRRRNTCRRISSIITDEDSNRFACTSFDGTVVHYDLRGCSYIGKTTPISGSDPRLISAALLNRWILVCATADNRLVAYDWSQWESAQAHLVPRQSVIPIQDIVGLGNHIVTALYDGSLRVESVLPDMVTREIARMRTVDYVDINEVENVLACGNSFEIKFMSISELKLELAGLTV